MTPIAGVAIFVVVTVAVPAAVLGLKQWGQRAPIAWLSKCLGATTLLQELTDAPTHLLCSPRLLLQTAGLQLAIFVFDALTLWLTFNAIGDVPPLWVVFVSFIIASMVATIGPIPVGLGTFEATSVGCWVCLAWRWRRRSQPPPSVARADVLAADAAWHLVGTPGNTAPLGSANRIHGEARLFNAASVACARLSCKTPRRALA
ncbi:lysylphosphatidylglycerol synthase domain-containing protein [Paraburkholderia sp. DGU8]|uniref:lysylphosphatidylglycerol synthase domain-containing protein n=1 Tax=Paraburkholderia sp. DGU8 TaxID=3161997 RepID=UPI0034653E59